MELDKAKSFFEMKDSIMEATLPLKMREFIGKGGQPQLMVKLLAGHYRGLAQMSNLISDWLLLSGMDESEVNTLIEDELKQLILQNFDPKKADTIFREGSQGAPDWLLKMIKQPQWRSLIYQLAETHKNCLLLNFAIQRISDEGYQNEIASLVDQSTYFGVFNRVLKETLLHLFKCDESTLPQHIADFKKMSSSSEHTYFYTQTLLSALASEEHSLKRLIQELETSVSERGKIIQNMSLLFSSLSDYPQISSSITAMICDRVTTPGDVVVLYNAYSAANAPPVEFIRNPILLDLLVNDLFNPAKSVNNTYLSKYFYLLAYASTHDDSNIMEDEELKATVRGLATAQEICHKNSYGIELQHSFPELKETLIYPVVSMGILHWIKCNLADSEYYRTTSHTFSIPIKFQLLRDINERYPLQRSKIMDILSNSFTVETGLDALASLELKKKFIDVMIDLMKTGYALPVLHFIEQMASKTDQSLIRYFILQLMDIIEPPYSQEFLNALLSLVEKPETIEAMKSTDKKDLLLAWVEHCLETEYEWDDHQKATLQKLSNTFS